MYSHIPSRAEALRKLAAFTALQREASHGLSKSTTKPRLAYSQLAGNKLHWGGTSNYRAYKVAERTLDERKLTGCELLALWFFSDKDPGRTLKYQPVIINGRIVK